MWVYRASGCRVGAFTVGAVGDLLVGDFTRGVMLWVDEWLWVPVESRPGMPVPEVGAR